MLTRRRRFIREKVESILSENNVTAPSVPVDRLATRYGIVVRTEPLDGDISGFLARQTGKPGAIVGINANQAPPRQRFTLAHELGHFFLHGDQGKDEVHVDSSTPFVVKLRDGTSGQGIHEDEKEANLFAAELLMPLLFLEREPELIAGFDLRSTDEKLIPNLAKRYAVSSQAMSNRLGYLTWQHSFERS